MDKDILIAAIPAVLALVGTFFGSRSAVATSQKITEVKLEELTREVRQHNNFAVRVPVIENDIKALYRRIEELEREN